MPGRTATRPPLHLAAVDGYFELVRTFLRHNADVNAQTPDGDTVTQNIKKRTCRHCTVTPGSRRRSQDTWWEPEDNIASRITPREIGGGTPATRTWVDVDAEDDVCNTAYCVALKQVRRERSVAVGAWCREQDVGFEVSSRRSYCTHVNDTSLFSLPMSCIKQPYSTLY